MSSPPPLGPAALRSLFDELRARGVRLLRRDALRRALARVLPRAWRVLPLVPLLVLALQGVRAVAGASPGAPSWLLLLTLTLAVPTAFVLRSLLQAWREPVNARAALGLFDDAAGAEERLLAADDLLRAPLQSGFAAAALEDAAPWVGRARRAEPVLPQPATHRTPLALVSAGVTIALVLLVLQVGGNPFWISTEGDLIPQPDVAVSRRGQAPREEPNAPRPKPRASAPAGGDARRAPEAGVSSGSGEVPPPPPQDLRPRAGLGGAGRSSEAAAAAGGDARGRPSGQADGRQPPQAHKKQSKPAAPKKPTTPKKDEDEQGAGEESGSTSGRGASRGSDRNPVTSEWRSRDQVTSEAEEEIEDDESVEDEEVDSEARGGVQPSLRDRKPPASRDLSVGFGNRPSPNANGRGGASQPKKSRGTASLVLGVPIPDRIKGRPNPGRTKVTQERVAPRRESAPEAEASARTPRVGPSGALARPEMAPWLRTLLRDYFTRPHTEAAPPQETPDR